MALLSLLAFAAQAEPQQATEADVGACRFLSSVSGDSGYGKNSGWQSLAKHAALRRAGNLGASHVVWERFIPVGAFNGIAEAKAYTCDGQRNVASRSTP